MGAILTILSSIYLSSISAGLIERNQEEARTYCQQNFGGDLAVIDSADENAFVFNLEEKFVYCSEWHWLIICL